MEENLTWESARTKCKDDDGDMICFRDRQERDKITSVCNGCWVGYNWEDGKSCYYLDFIDLENRVIIRYLLSGRWTPITTRFGKTCPENVVSGNSGLSYDCLLYTSPSPRD